MSTSAVKSSHQPAAEAAEQFWRSAKQLASAAAAVAGASPSALVEAGVRSHPRQVEAGELAAELTALSDKINEVRRRLATSAGQLVSCKERNDAEETMRKMVQSRALVDSTSFTQKRNVTRQALSKALKAHRVFYVEVEGQRYFPDFFLDPRYERRQVEDVSKALGELPGASKLQFFTTKKASLEGETPLAALAAGRFSRVRTAAQGFVER